MASATERIATEADRASATLAATDPNRDVPTCPGWTADDLLWHITEAHEFWASNLATNALTDADAERNDTAKAPRPDGEDAREELLARRERATASLIRELDSRDDAQPAWTWSAADQTVGFTRRMQVHEATMHRVDAELTAGREITPIEREVAADGLGHVTGVMLASSYDWIPEWATLEQVATLTLRPTDGEPLDLELAVWHGTRPRDGEEFSHAVARPLQPEIERGEMPQATASADVASLYLWLWGRPAEVELTGDDAAVAQVDALLVQGID
jgi:uncharacterized protein (TIGR03083 family)